MAITNADRAARALDTLKHYTEAHDTGADLRSAATDLITDILHLAALDAAETPQPSDGLALPAQQIREPFFDAPLFYRAGVDIVDDLYEGAAEAFKDELAQEFDGAGE